MAFGRPSRPTRWAPHTWCLLHPTIFRRSRPLLLLLFATLLSLELCVRTSVQAACCDNEPKPLTDCSFYSKSQGQMVLCNLRKFATRGSPCHENFAQDTNNIPGPANNLQVSLYHTKCDQTLLQRSNQNAPLCRTNCSHANGTTYTGINITFSLDKPSASKLEAVEIQLFGLDSAHGTFKFCVFFEFGIGTITYSDAEVHKFYYDGFIGLVPGDAYHLTVRTLPTDGESGKRNWATRTFTVPTCWMPTVESQSTPQVLNLSLHLDIGLEHSDYYGITGYSIDVYAYGTAEPVSSLYIPNTPCSTLPCKAEVTTTCLQPGKYDIEIYPHDCDSCMPANFTEIIHAEVPIIKGCHGDVMLYVERGSGRAVVATWQEPTASRPLQEDCLLQREISSNQSHDLGIPLKEGDDIIVTYAFWQYPDDIKTCSFHVSVIGVMKPEIQGCPQNQEVLVEYGERAASVNWTSPVSVGSEVDVVASHQPGHLFPVGTTTLVSYIFLGQGNATSTNCSFEISVIESEAPPQDVLLAVVVGSILGVILVGLLLFLVVNFHKKGCQIGDSGSSTSPNFEKVPEVPPAGTVDLNFLLESQSVVSTKREEEDAEKKRLTEEWVCSHGNDSGRGTSVESVAAEQEPLRKQDDSGAD